MADRPEPRHPAAVPALPTAVLNAYLAAHYRVHLPKRIVTVRIGARYPLLDKGLRRQDWQLITPCNPGAQPLPPAENARRLDQLQALLVNAGALLRPAANIDPAGQWPDEPGWLVSGLAPARTIALARHFSQDALVAGRAGEATELWLVGRGAAGRLPPHVVDHAA